MSWFNPSRWLLLLAFSAALLLGYEAWASHQQGIGYARAQAEFSAKVIKAENAARATEQAMQTKTDELRGELNGQIIKLGISLDAALALVRVQHSTPRPADYVPPTPSTDPGCSGASLYTQDAEFLIREAGRADTQRLQLEACQAQYLTAFGALR